MTRMRSDHDAPAFIAAVQQLLSQHQLRSLTIPAEWDYDNGGGWLYDMGNLFIHDGTRPHQLATWDMSLENNLTPDEWQEFWPDVPYVYQSLIDPLLDILQEFYASFDLLNLPQGGFTIYSQEVLNERSTRAIHHDSHPRSHLPEQRLF
jgi:hypothetical protein